MLNFTSTNSNKMLIFLSKNNNKMSFFLCKNSKLMLIYLAANVLLVCRCKKLLIAALISARADGSKSGSIFFTVSKA
jgi:hypothetical protein